MKIKGRVAVSLKARSEIICAFRDVQRYRGDADPVPWSEYEGNFKLSLSRICKKHGIEEVETILRYFVKFWFCPYWRSSEFLTRLICITHAFIEHVTDEGLPLGQTRDGVWNTNNNIESSFRTLNKVFLQNRQNKR